MSALPPDAGATAALPTLFLSHGAPTIALDDSPAHRFLAGFGAALGRPRAVLMVSAHWETPEVAVMAAPAPSTVHDFFGFPESLYRLHYPAPGDAVLAAEIAGLLRGSGYAVTLDDARGYDHGAWVPMRLMYPAADVPMVQLSINPQRPPAWHWRLGRSLLALRHAGVLVVGSGSMTHNLQDFRRHRDDVDSPVEAYAAEFTEWFARQLAARELDATLAYRESAPHAVRAHPTDEHLLPLFVALGAAGIGWTAERVHHGFMHGAIAMDCYRFQSGAAVECASPDHHHVSSSGEKHVQ